jgi:hypothetical protein
VLEPLRIATAHGIRYFFDDQWAQFALEHRFSAAVASLDLLPLVLALATAAGLVSMAWLGRGVRRRLALLAIATWSGYTILYAQRGLEMHPHYQFATWWIVLVGVAGLHFAWQRRAQLAARLVLFGVIALTTAQVAFIVSWVTFIRAHGGTNGPHYGATLTQQVRAIQRACDATASHAAVTNDTGVFAESLSYIAESDPACAGKHLQIVRPPAPWAPLRIGYRQPGAAFLVLGNNE